MKHLRKYKIFESFSLDSVNWEDFKKAEAEVLSELNRIHKKIGLFGYHKLDFNEHMQVFFYKDGEKIDATKEFFHPKPNSNTPKWAELIEKGMVINVGLDRAKIEPILKSATETEKAYDMVKDAIIDLIDDEKIKFKCIKPFNESDQVGFKFRGGENVARFIIFFNINQNASDILDILSEAKNGLGRFRIDLKDTKCNIQHSDDGYLYIIKFEIPI